MHSTPSAKVFSLQRLLETIVSGKQLRRKENFFFSDDWHFEGK